MYLGKLTITVKEASEWSGIGINRLRDMMHDPNCPFVFYTGKRKLVKTAAFFKWFESAYSA